MFSRIEITFNWVTILVIAIVLYGCGSEDKKKNQTHISQLSFSNEIVETVNDTSKITPVIDSLKKLLLISNSEQQLIILGELAEVWRPYTYTFANELLLQSGKSGNVSGQSDAYAKFGIFYTRKSNFDSANYYFTRSEKLANKLNSTSLLAQVISWKAEGLRIKGFYDSTILLQNKAISLAEQVNDIKRLAFCNISKGEANRFLGKSEEAISCYQKSIQYSEQINDKNKITMCLNSIGDLYRVQSNYPEALNYFNKALSLAKSQNNKNQIAFCLSCMGDIFSAQKELDKALKFFEEAYLIAEETGAQIQQCNILSSMALVYDQAKNFDKALEYIEKSNELSEKIGYIDKLAFGYSAMGSIYFNQAKYEEAAESVKQSIAIAKETGNSNLLASTQNQLADIFLKQGKLIEGKISAEAALKLSQENKIINNIRESAHILSLIHKAQYNFKSSLEMLDLFIKMKDSVNNEENVKKIAAIEYQAKEEGLKAEQRAKELSFKAEQEKKETELKRQKTIRYAFTIGFVLVLLLVGVVFRSLQQNKKKNKIIVAQKKEVEHQKELVEEKNKEITDSITYAKRLQDAILPPIRLVQNYFPNSFILYKPKDIIAGDFYWMEKLDDTLFFAAADSTGHGVPGAMVSVVCSNALNRAVKEFKLKEPGRILDKTRELVLETFEKSEGDVKDGMDISLISINQVTKTILWSGANNPIWYINNNQFHEIKATKQPIGKTEYPQPFITHQIDFIEGTSFYLITDGFADQFGGPKGKKFKYKNLQELLLQFYNTELIEQGKLLDQEFEKWRGQLDQIDDVTIIGFKI